MCPMHSGFPQLRWQFFRTARIRNLIVRQREKCPGELIRIILKPQLVSCIFVCTFLLRESDRELSIFKPNVSEGNLWVSIRATMDNSCSYPIHAW